MLQFLLKAGICRYSHRIINFLFSVSFNKVNNAFYFLKIPAGSIIATVCSIRATDVISERVLAILVWQWTTKNRSISYTFGWAQNLGILLNKISNYVFISVQKCFFSARQTAFLQNIHLKLNGNGKPLQNGNTTGS